MRRLTEDTWIRWARPPMWVLWVGLAYIVLALPTQRFAWADAAGAAREPACREVARVLDTTVMDDLDPAHTLLIAPYAGPTAARALIARITSGPTPTPAAAYDAFLAVGMTRQAEALRTLNASTPSTQYSVRVARSLGLLALGDGSDTGTVARALYEGPTEDRRHTARALSFMRQRRPQMLLWDALEDVDPEVRYFAAKVLVDSGAIRARRVLADLFRGPDKALAARAARVLAKSGYSFKPDELAQLPIGLRLDALASDYGRARRVSPTMLLALSRSPDDVTRAAAWAALAASGLELASSPLKRLALKPPEPAPPELAAALALAGDAPASKSLEALDRVGAAAAVRVFYAYGGAGAKAPLEAMHAAELARVVELWMARGLLEDRTASLALRAIARVEPLAGLRLARTRLAGPAGRALVTAVKIIGRSGAATDAAALVGVARRLPGRARAEAWRAAARVCG